MFNTPYPFQLPQNPRPVQIVRRGRMDEFHLDERRESVEERGVGAGGNIGEEEEGEEGELVGRKAISPMEFRLR